MKLFDTHCHLDILAKADDYVTHIMPTFAELLTTNQVHYITQIATDLKSAQFGLELTNYNQNAISSDHKADPNVPEDEDTLIKANIRQNYPFLDSNSQQTCFSTIGLHPCSHEQAAEVPGLTEMARAQKDNPRFVAIGEIGLDFYWEKEVADIQVPIFEHFLELGKELNRPVVVHCRDAFEETYNSLKNVGNGQGIIHCFTGNKDWATKFADLGYMISFSGIVTFKSAADIQEACKKLPSEQILIETDAPYLAPVPKRGRTNQPAFVKHTYDFICELRGENKNSFHEKLLENSQRIFQIEQSL